MFDLSRVKVLHLEITSHCNAACPMCKRFEGDDISPNLVLSDLSVDDMIRILPEGFVKQLDKMFMCGNHGDPAAGKHTLEVYKWFRDLNPNITLGMNTNGAIKTTSWWERLGSMLNRERDYVIFSIDGMADTNHIYRRNVSWTKLMENAAAFIAAGGRAHWEMLVFEHNEHQVSAAEELAQSMGFKFFRTKISKRFSTNPIPYLSPPKNFSSNFHDSSEDIDCIALREKSIYLDSQGKLSPCCWLGLDAVHKHKSYEVQGFVPSKDNATCLRTCGIKEKSNFEKQWEVT